MVDVLMILTEGVVIYDDDDRIRTIPFIFIRIGMYLRSFVSY